ncbi:NTP transferase domain-containing protein [Geomonas sp. RF6]|uniref:NTP transferase domain-containing protein n=1 Tax=Geomonas sp. RF6 TaxID=2897342 RepID=UPI001E2D7D01|nr:sugar phosphate nucleotidyltransferase [Geomonas sp. RF6]UFS69731.1 NTP transferase domain-containing protein [Geomonas sp. RF6]
MQIVIPMSGFGERFRRAGYTEPKPLIEIDGKPIIAHVVEMFPGESDFLFICNEDHLRHPDYRMEETLRLHAPSGRIAGIPPHKLGPVHAVRQVEHLIDPDRPVLINYCDFTCYWDWDHFRSFVARTACAGAIPAYRGFHPHSLGSTNYAYLREEGGWVSDIREKEPFTCDRMQEFASSGTYYFASGRLMSDALRAAVEQGWQVGGEYYVSLAYRHLFAHDLPVAVYPLQHFMQWGTPEDVAEYRGWSAAFRDLAAEKVPSLPAGTLVVPMAGLGERFAQEGYPVPKPLIPVSGEPMVVQATRDLPVAANHVFVVRSDMPGHREISRTLADTYPGAVIETLPGVTEGQACTALAGLEALERALGEVPGPVTFGACDNGVLYDPERLRRLLDDPETDVVVWGARGHANAVRRPEMFGWIDAERGAIRGISVKKPLGDPATDPIVIGTFTFRSAADFRRVVQRLMSREGRVNGEFYLDSCINDALQLGLTCRLFEVDGYLSWGTPNDLKSFEYWQSCFHKWSGHSYLMELDGRIPPEALSSLTLRYQALVPEVPLPRM